MATGSGKAFQCPLKEESFRRMFAAEVAEQIFSKLVNPDVFHLGGTSVLNAVIKQLEFKEQVEQVAGEVIRRLEEKAVAVEPEEIKEEEHGTDS